MSYTDLQDYQCDLLPGNHQIGRMVSCDELAAGHPNHTVDTGSCHAAMQSAAEIPNSARDSHHVRRAMSHYLPLRYNPMFVATQHDKPNRKSCSYKHEQENVVSLCHMSHMQAAVSSTLQRYCTRGCNTHYRIVQHDIDAVQTVCRTICTTQQHETFEQHHGMKCCKTFDQGDGAEQEIPLCNADMYSCLYYTTGVRSVRQTV